MPQYNLYGRGLSLKIAIGISCSFAFFLFGYDQGVFSSVVGNEDWLQQFNYPDSAFEGIIVSIYNLGAFSGCILTFIVGERLGRRRCMWLAMAWIIVGAILQSSSYSVVQLMIGRYVTGIGTGIETSTVPMYQSELCDANKRGRLVSSEPLFVGVGIVTAYFFDFGVNFVRGSIASIAWRLPIACQIIPAIIVIIMVLGLPESPRWLYRHGRPDEALQVICDVWDSKPDGDEVQEMNNEILTTIKEEAEQGEYGWRDLFTRDSVQTDSRVLLAYGMQFMNQMGGINLVVYFVPTALQQNVGLSRTLSLIIGGCVQTMFFFGSLFPTFFLDKIGRRNPMMWGSVGCGLSMMMIAILLSFQQAQYSEDLAKKTSEASVAFFFLYMLIFGATANCIPWVYVAEILPLRARAKGVAIGTSANWLWNFVVVMISPTIIDNLAWKGYLIFMALNFAFVPLVYTVYPETSNLSLEEIDLLFIERRDTARHGFTRKFTTKAVQASLDPIKLKKRELENTEEKVGRSEHIERIETP